MKQSIADLAIFGGRPEFEHGRHVGCPNIGDRRQFLERINAILDSKWLTNNGRFVQEFERRVAGLLGVEHCVAVANGTLALEIAIRALGMTGEAIVPAFSFVATAHALEWQQITPIFCDIEPQFCTLDPDRVAALITPRTTGIIAVHVWGRPCQIERLEEIARQHRLKLLFDASHAFGCTYRGRPIGSFGDTEVFSFHATKFVNTFEGGAIVTNDGVVADKVRLMRNFGFRTYDEVVSIGTNGKMSEPCAAMGLTSLDAMDEFIQCNRRNYLAYAEALAGIPGISLMRYDESERNNFQYVAVQVDALQPGISRDAIVKTLFAENVLARRYFYPGCHRMEPYRSSRPDVSGRLTQTEWLTERVMCLPTGSAVSPGDVNRICALVRLIVQHGHEIAQRLGAVEAGSDER